MIGFVASPQTAALVLRQMKQEHLATLSQWAQWRKAFAPTRTRHPDWSAVEFLIEAAQPRLLEEARAFRILLERSTTRLKLTDPLLCELGIHRWLDKETAYSDWFAWVLERLADPSQVLRILGVEGSRWQVCRGLPCWVRREAQLTKGLSGSKGQIDLLIGFGEGPRALIGVEVKTYDQQFRKQRGYSEALRELCPPCSEGILIADPKHVRGDNLWGFRLQEWRKVSIELRRAVAWWFDPDGHGSNDQATAAMILGFVAAIEQNLLGMTAAAARRAWQGKPILFPQAMAEYLREFLEPPNDRV